MHRRVLKILIVQTLQALINVPKDQGENVKRKVSDICNCVDFPEGYMDMSLILLTRSKMPSAAARPSSSSLSAQRAMHFGDDLTAADKAAKAKMWHLVQQARNQGKGGYYRGI
ncbi:unnamed protein product [Coregonus sp. 'balchen']|nr:unnamed protein product [Coregonus sp. 'balchen']